MEAEPSPSRSLLAATVQAAAAAAEATFPAKILSVEEAARQALFFDGASATLPGLCLRHEACCSASLPVLAHTCACVPSLNTFRFPAPSLPIDAASVWSKLSGCVGAEVLVVHASTGQEWRVRVADDGTLALPGTRHAVSNTDGGVWLAGVDAPSCCPAHCACLCAAASLPTRCLQEERFTAWACGQPRRYQRGPAAGADGPGRPGLGLRAPFAPGAAPWALCSPQPMRFSGQRARGAQDGERTATFDQISGGSSALLGLHTTL